MFLTYAEYQAYGGTIDVQSTFNQLEFEAECMINYVTFNRLKNTTTFSENVKRCTFALISALQNMQAASSAGGLGSETSAAVASESNDGFSVSYNVTTADRVYDIAKEQVEGIIQKYLAYETDSLGRRLTYRGIYEDE